MRPRVLRKIAGHPPAPADLHGPHEQRVCNPRGPIAVALAFQRNAELRMACVSHCRPRCCLLSCVAQPNEDINIRDGPAAEDAEEVLPQLLRV
eukprot:10822957-Lingulodinium_polyedra.AAC.1